MSANIASVDASVDLTVGLSHEVTAEVDHGLPGTAPQAEATVPIVKTPTSPVNPASGLVLHWPTEAATEAFAQTLAAQPGLRTAFIELHGDLGAGKTTLVRHLLRALGVQGRVKSPTFAVVEPYTVADANAPSGQLDIWHFDFYRFDDPREWADAGFRDIFASLGLKLAEWPANVGADLPQADLSIRISVHDDASRSAEVIAPTALGTAILQALAAGAAT